MCVCVCVCVSVCVCVWGVNLFHVHNRAPIEGVIQVSWGVIRGLRRSALLRVRQIREDADDVSQRPQGEST
jgi:hypothetical protein